MTRIFVYEFITSGGLYHWSEQPCGSLLKEGRAMLEALRADLADVDGIEVVHMWDRRLADPPDLERSVRIPVRSADEERDVFQRLCRGSDEALIIAPELDGWLTRKVLEAEACGTSLLSPSARFVAWASNKTQTIADLAAASVPVAAAVACQRPGELPPQADFWPAVVKPNDGAGSVGISCGSRQQAETRLASRTGQSAFCVQRFHPGVPASVAVLSGPARSVILPGCHQLLERDSFAYRGGELIAAADLQQRCQRLARQVVKVLSDVRGYIGIDLVLGPRTCGGDDVVIEINPRLTTSYVGLRAATTRNLADVMRQIVRGQSVDFSPTMIPVTFDSRGKVQRIIPSPRNMP